jgi:hypothetical protein
MFSDPKFKSNFTFSVSIPQFLDHVELKGYLLFDAIYFIYIFSYKIFKVNFKIFYIKFFLWC